MAVPASSDCAGTFTLVERSITIGDGTDYAFDGKVDGLGNPQTKNSDVQKGHGDGDVPQHDFYGPRPITIPISIAPAPNESPSRATLWGRWKTLRTAWEKSFDVDLTLEHEEVGSLDVYVGRPDFATLDDTAWRSGQPLLRVLLGFRCSDPTRY